MNAIRAALAAALLIGLAACGGLGGSSAAVVDKSRVQGDLDGLRQGLRAGTWSRVERYFSPAFYEGYGELRARIEEQMRRQTLLDLQFDVTWVLEADGLINAQVRWKKSWIDHTSGATRKAEGVGEFILEPRRQGGYRILAISGDRPF